MDGIIKRPAAASGTVRIGAVRAGAAAAPAGPRPAPVGRPAAAAVPAAAPGGRAASGTVEGAAAFASQAGTAPVAARAVNAPLEPRPAMGAPQPGAAASADRPAPVPPPMPDLEALRASARAAGYQEGRTAAERELATLGQSLRERFDACLDALRAAHLRLQREMEDACMDIAFAAVVQVFGRASADPAMVHQAVQQALRQAGALGGLRIRLHPQDAQALAPLLAGWVPDHADGRLPAPVICPDPSVGRGGCILSSDQGDIDARLETQLQHLAALLQRHREAAMASPGEPNEPGAEGVPE